MPCGDNKNTTNTIGKMSEIKKAVSTRPYIITECDQILIFSGETINDDFNDYFDRVPSFFTMNMYIVNQFSSRTADNLLKSIYMESISEVPTVFQGSKTCLKFIDGTYQTKFGMCLSDEEEVKEVIQAYDNFMRCRIGDNLQKPESRIIPLPCSNITNLIANSKILNDAIQAHFSFEKQINKPLTTY